MGDFWGWGTSRRRREKGKNTEGAEDGSTLAVHMKAT
jgi:hypothetical protein